MSTLIKIEKPIVGGVKVKLMPAFLRKSDEAQRAAIKAALIQLHELDRRIQRSHKNKLAAEDYMNASMIGGAREA